MEEVHFDRTFGLSLCDSEILKSFNSTLKDLRGLVISNVEFYHRGRSALHARFYASFCILLERIQILEPLVLEIVPYLQKFDFSEDVPGNGYRSFISLIYRCCLYLLQLSRHIHTSRSSLFFQSSRYCKDLESYVETLGQLVACLTYLKQLMAYCSDGELFLKDDSVVGDSLLLQIEMINTDCFYGRCLGFQFCETIQKVLQAVLVVMATFSECYDEPSQVMQLASSLLNSGKYVIDQELRARQVVNITRTGDIKFCKAFWSIPESPIFSQLRSFTFPHVEVSEIISLDPENFELPSTTSDETVTITPPCAHTGPAPVKVRLISHAVREGQDTTRKRFKPKTGSSKPAILPKSERLLFHCHGGGFVAQSSQSHESYLRAWARELEVPILSVDYSLAPDFPFPRALEECFFAYAWALKNPEKLGWTGEKVCFAGDSAGANLVISTALRAVSFEIRVPDGIMSAYAPVLIQYTPSPARFMSMIDPLLPVGILMRCLAAYAGIADELSTALSKPIFCNPGAVESWEVVESTNVQHIDNYIGERQPHSADELHHHSEVGTVTDEEMTDNSNDHHTDVTLSGDLKDITSGELQTENENVHIANHDGATTCVVANLSTNEVKLDTESKRKNSIENKSNESSISDNDIVIVDEKMIPDEKENENHSAGFTSSKFFGFIKKEATVKSLVSGVKSFIARHKGAKVPSPEKETVEKIHDVNESEPKTHDAQHLESNVDSVSPVKHGEVVKGGKIECQKESCVKDIEETDSLGEQIDMENQDGTFQKESDMEIADNHDINIGCNCETLEMDKQEYRPSSATDIRNENQNEHIKMECDVNNVQNQTGGTLDQVTTSVTHRNIAQEEQNVDSDFSVPHICDTAMEDDCGFDTGKYNLNETDLKSGVNSHVSEGKFIVDTVKSMDFKTGDVNTSDSVSGNLEFSGKDNIKYNERDNFVGSVEVDEDYETDIAEDMEKYLDSMNQYPVTTKAHDFEAQSQVCSCACQQENISEKSRINVSEDSDGVLKESCYQVTAVDSGSCDSEDVKSLDYFGKENTDINEPVDQSHQASDPDPTELYAVCQELLDQAVCYGQGYRDTGEHDTIMGSSSCHTIEDRSSFYFYGDDRRLSIHSEGSCNSIEDSHAWMTGQDIDILEIDSNDIVTDIIDCDYDTFQNERINADETNSNDLMFYISTSDQNERNVEKCIRDQTQSLSSQENLLHCDMNVSVDKNERDTNDTSRIDPVSHTAPAENKIGTEMELSDTWKANRRALSLDLTHGFNESVPEKNLFSPTKGISLPRSSTVPELLSGSVTPKLFSVQRNIAQSPIQLFRKLPIVKNPYMSPILAPDEMIVGLPVVHLVACHFDPLLDDSVMFARKLRHLEKDVTLHIVDNLPHGFLNFSDASPEAKQASKYCLSKIKEVLKIEDK